MAGGDHESEKAIAGSMTTITKAATVGTSFLLWPVLMLLCPALARSTASRYANQRDALDLQTPVQLTRKEPALTVGRRCTPCANSSRWFRTDRRTSHARLAAMR